MLAPDIEKRARSDAKDQVDAFLCRLNAFAEESPPPADRVLRCVVHLAGGKLEHLESAIHNAKLDWRDVIVSAEYEPKPGTKRWQGDLIHVRDFNLPFP